MSKYWIEGGERLSGQLAVHGAKNAALPILAAALLCENSVLHNCPRLSDVEAACSILRSLGCQVHREEDTVTVDTRGLVCHTIPDRLMREMRSSVIFLGALLSRCGEARISLPGGCELGPRPIDIHLAGLRRMGVEIREDHGCLDCRVPGFMTGAEITLPFPSVGATENLMLAACTARGITILRNAAREPEIGDLAAFLTGAGARIALEPDASIRIEGRERLEPFAEHRVLPDRIAAATYLCAAAAAGGDLTLTCCRPDHLAAVLPLLEEMGCRVRTEEDRISLCRRSPLRPVHLVRTMPYPGFPTDAQSPLLAVTTLARGTSIFVENIFESRYKQVPELLRMGACIKVEGRVAVVEGVRELHSASLRCTDLRGGAALCIAALAAEGVSELSEVRHMDRGYENFENNLAHLGAKITRE